MQLFYYQKYVTEQEDNDKLEVEKKVKKKQLSVKSRGGSISTYRFVSIQIYNVLKCYERFGSFYAKQTSENPDHPNPYWFKIMSPYVYDEECCLPNTHKKLFGLPQKDKSFVQ